MTKDNPAMSFFPLQRQLLGNGGPTDDECRDMLAEAWRLAADLKRTEKWVSHYRREWLNSGATDRAATNALGNITHAMREDD